MTQCNSILDYLRTGNSLTPIDALQRFGCLRLAARIAELRSAGHLIVSEPLTLHNHKRVSRYWLIRRRPARKAGR